jgi:RNA polymerase sigma-54 factor
MELNLELKQTLALSPQMVQSMEVLQMGSQELLEHIEELVQENPVLEAEEPPRQADEITQIRRKLDWLESTDIQNRSYHRDDSEEERGGDYGGVEQWEENLYDYLLSQIPPLELEHTLNRAAVFLVESLDQNGYLDEEPDQLARAAGCPPRVMERALEVVQSLEPAGVGARNLAECLLLQLKRREADPLTLRIVEEGYLDALAKNHYGLIAKGLKAGQAQVRAACDKIRQLNPKPGSGFASRENLIYITPDIMVVNFPDHFELVSNDYYFPTLKINGYYKSLAKDTGDPDVKEYLADKMRQAKWAIRSIQQRRSTLMECAQCILELQEKFFRFGPGHLVPMSLADVARQLDVHESTVSRAVRDKYLQCASGVYPFGYFFSRGLGHGTGGEEGTAPDTAKALLKALVAGEDRDRPLSDQKLCQQMEEKGVRLSRRTVAKYRDELGIPSAAGRKRYDEKRGGES